MINLSDNIHYYAVKIRTFSLQGLQNHSNKLNAAVLPIIGFTAYQNISVQFITKVSLQSDIQDFEVQ